MSQDDFEEKSDEDARYRSFPTGTTRRPTALSDAGFWSVDQGEINPAARVAFWAVWGTSVGLFLALIISFGIKKVEIDSSEGTPEDHAKELEPYNALWQTDIAIGLALLAFVVIYSRAANMLLTFCGLCHRCEKKKNRAMTLSERGKEAEEETDKGNLDDVSQLRARGRQAGGSGDVARRQDLVVRDLREVGEEVINLQRKARRQNRGRTTQREGKYSEEAKTDNDLESEGSGLPARTKHGSISRTDEGLPADRFSVDVSQLKARQRVQPRGKRKGKKRPPEQIAGDQLGASGVATEPQGHLSSSSDIDSGLPADFSSDGENTASSSSDEERKKQKVRQGQRHQFSQRLLHNSSRFPSLTDADREQARDAVAAVMAEGDNAREEDPELKRFTIQF